MRFPHRPLVILAMFCLGFISMGFQLIASRLLAPHFGSSIMVWAFLIATFLAAFSIGSMFGGWLTTFSQKRRHLFTWQLVWLGAVGFGFTAFFGRSLLRLVESHIETLNWGLSVSCPALFLLPVTIVAAFPPLCADVLARSGATAGLASGLAFGFSALGNITGVMVTAFVLIPHFHTSHLLVAWTSAAGLCLLSLSFQVRGLDRELLRQGD